MIRWTDAHNHFADPRLAGLPDLWRSTRAAGVSRMIVNATCEADWPAIDHLAAENPAVIPAFGIHPWKAADVSNGWQERLAALLAKYPRATVGEIGVDGWVAEPGFEIQIPLFETQLRLARELRRPCMIHCLKVWQPLFDSFDRQSPPEKFLMHSFAGSLEIARRLIPLGAYFSFSGYFLHPWKAKILEIFRQLPKDRILLETDAPDMLPPSEFITHPLPENHNHPANLPAIGEALAHHLGISPEELAILTGENLTNFLATDH
ncbi:MAG: TatD family hydrolase [Verrucomicrobiota bacterium]